VARVSRAAQDRRTAEALYGLAAALVRRTPRDLSLTSLATLATLDRTGPRRITDLAVVEGVTQPSMTTLVANLERQGLAERYSDPNDGRVALVAITPKGRQYVRRRRKLGAESVAELIQKLSDDESAAIAEAVEVIIRLRQLDDEQRDGVARSRGRPPPSGTAASPSG
jgi:DNA-binding MarR family transcriptional regulator